MRFRVSARELMPLILILVICLAAGAKEPRFWQPMNLNSILLWMPLITIAAMGQLLVIVIRGIDISIGSILALTGAGVGLIYKAHPEMHPALGFLLGALFGLGLGLINASLIAYGKISPIVVTIGTLTAFRGAVFLLTKGDQIDSSMIPDSLTKLAKEGPNLGFATVSGLLLISLGVALLAWIMLRYTQLGRDIFAFGSNPKAAYLRGISTTKVTMIAYSLCGLTAGIAGVMYASRYGFVDPEKAGKNFELNVIAAVAIGGVKITGGYGTVLGVLLGCLLLSCINVTLTILGIDANWQQLTYGAIILIALVLDSVIRMSRRQNASA